MKKKIAFVIIALVLLPALISPALAQSAMQPIELVNPSFEGEYIAVPGGYVASGWQSHYKEGTVPPLAAVGGGSNPTRRPEFKLIDAEQYPERVADGQRAQVAFAFYGIMDAAFSQQVEVELGKGVQLSIEAHGWSTNSDDPNKHSGEVYVSLCIAAEGQTDPWAHGIECTRYLWTPGTYRTYYSRVVTAEAGTVTLIVMTTNKWAVKHNDFYLDNAKAWIVQEGGTTPQPTQTPYPTLTPWPTPQVTPCPTCIPGGGCDYGIIREIIREELANREPVYWPR